MYLLPNKANAGPAPGFKLYLYALRGNGKGNRITIHKEPRTGYHCCLIKK